MTFNPGDRVELVSMPDDQHPVPVGTKGTVRSRSRVCLDPRDTFTQYHIQWDNGRTLSACCPPDQLKPSP